MTVGVAGMGGVVLRPVRTPLQWSVVDRYARRHEIHGEDFDSLWWVLRKLDQEYLDFEAEKAKSE